MAVNFPPCPATLKIHNYLKIATEHDGRDLVVTYWCRLYALQIGLKNTTKEPDENAVLLSVMDWLEKIKKQNPDNDGILNEIVAQAHLENYALKLFEYADKLDRCGDFGKNVVKAFYTSGMLYDILQTFGELTDEAFHNRKYAKWKAAYIHTCLKNGATPIPGPLTKEEGGDIDSGGGWGAADTTQTTPNDCEGAFGGGALSPTPRNPLQPPPTAAEVLSNPDRLPNPPVDEERLPGGFVPYVAPAQPHPADYIPPPTGNVQLTPEQIQKSQKYCKHAVSALNFDDVKSAIENLQKALHLLQTGEELS